MSELPFSARTPTSIARVGLVARDAEALAAFYRTAVGLQELSRDGSVISLGTSERPLLDIISDKAAQPDDPRAAGLYHTAFLMPSRADLGRWVRHAIDTRIPVSGASDHLVSEALYLNDPEGNGIEIYADRPETGWHWNGGEVAMATERLDVEALLASVPAGDAGWNGMPGNGVVGHVHLRVGNAGEAEAFWTQEFGFDAVARYGSAAVFLSSGGYHHHIGANAWHSARAGQRKPGLTGLAWVELRSSEASAEVVKQDPWGTVIRTLPGLPG